MKNKRFISYVSVALTVVLVLGAFLAGCASSDDGAVVSIGEATGLAGDIVKLPFSIDDNCGIWGGQVIINYDSSIFEFVSCNNGDVFDMCDSNDNKGQLCLVVTQLGAENTDKNGLVATINFKIKDIADDGDYEISFDEETNFSNIDGEIKEVAFKNGTVTVK